MSTADSQRIGISDTRANLKRSRPRTFARRLASWVVAVLTTLVAVELGVRAYGALTVGPSAFFFGLRPDRDQLLASSVENRTGGYSKYFPRQKRVMRDWKNVEEFDVAINQNGFRGRDFDVVKGAGVIRIVTLGASSTFGYGDRDDETYPVILERFLNEESGNRPYEVINLGIPHLSIEQNLALFMNEALPLTPDIVTFYEGANDARVEEGLGPVSTERASNRLVAGVENWFKLGQHMIFFNTLTGWVIYNTWAQHTTYGYDGPYLAQSLNKQAAAFVQRLDRLRDVCQRNGIVFILANQQMKSSLVPVERIRGITYADEVKLVKARLAEQGRLGHDPWKMIFHEALMSKAREWAVAGGVPFVDVIHAMDQDRDQLTSYVHLSPKGNAIVARELSKAILAQTLPQGQAGSLQ